MFTAITVSRTILRTGRPLAMGARPSLYGVNEEEFVTATVRRLLADRRAEATARPCLTWSASETGSSSERPDRRSRADLHPAHAAHRRRGGREVLDRLHRRHGVADPLPGPALAVGQVQAVSWRRACRAPRSRSPRNGYITIRTGRWVAGARSGLDPGSGRLARRAGSPSPGSASVGGGVRPPASPRAASASSTAVRRALRPPRVAAAAAAPAPPEPHPARLPAPPESPTPAPVARRPTGGGRGAGDGAPGEVRPHRGDPRARRRSARSSARSSPSRRSCSSIGSLGILLWVSVRFQDVKFGVSAIAALFHDVIVVVGTFAILGTLFGVQVDAPLRDGDADRHRLLGPRHDRDLRPDPREPGAPRGGDRSRRWSTAGSSRRLLGRSTRR